MSAIPLLRPILTGLLLIAATPALGINVERVNTPGGIEAWLVQDHSNPIVTIRFAFRGGAALDPPGKVGLANLVASTIDEGAGDLDSQSFQKTTEDKAIRIRFDVGMDNFGGQLQTLVRNRDEAFDLLRLTLNSPRFDSEPVERVRSQILAGLKQDEESTHSIAGKAMREALYGDHPYGRPADGTLDSIKAITADDLRAFVTQRLTRDTLVIGVVGNITPAELGELLDTTFGTLPTRGTDWRIPKVRANTDGRTIVIDKDVPQSAILFADQGLLRDDPDFYAGYVMNHILGGGGFTSRLYGEVREKRGLAYTISSGLNPRRASATTVGGAGTVNARVRETLDVIKTEWRRMAENGVEDDELRDAKTYLTGAYPLRFTDSTRIARMLVGIQLAELGIDYVKNRNAFIDAVTRDDIARVAKKLLDVNRLVTVIVGRPEGLPTTR